MCVSFRCTIPVHALFVRHTHIPQQKESAAANAALRQASKAFHVPFAKEAADPAHYAFGSPMHSLDRHVVTGEGLKRRDAKSPLPALQARADAAQRKLSLAEENLRYAVKNQKTMYDIVAALFRDIINGKPLPDSHLDADTLTQLRAHLQPTQPFGAMFSVWLHRARTGNRRSMMPDVMFRFATACLGSSAATAHLLRGALPGILPSKSTMAREHNSADAITGPSDPALQRLSDLLARPDSTPEDAIGFLAVDEAGIKQARSHPPPVHSHLQSLFVCAQGLEMNAAKGMLLGFVDASPLEIAARVNSGSNTWNTLIPSLATHTCVYYFQSFNGRISIPIATYFVNETEKTKDVDLLLHGLEVVTLAGLRGIIITCITFDNAQSNRVC